MIFKFSKAVVVMTRELDQIQYFERRGPWSNITDDTFFSFVFCFEKGCTLC